MTVKARPLTAKEAGLCPGVFLTDGHRLIEIRRVSAGTVLGEEGPVDTPDIVSLSLSEVLSDWRIVEPSGG